MNREGTKRTSSHGKRDVHLVVDANIFRLAKVECAKADVDLSRATEQLWKLWAQGKATVESEK